MHPPRVWKTPCPTEYHPLLHLSGNQPQQTASQFSVFYWTLLIVSWSPGRSTPCSSASHPSSILATLQGSCREQERSWHSWGPRRREQPGSARLARLDLSAAAGCSCYIHDPSQFRPLNTLLLLWTHLNWNYSSYSWARTWTEGRNLLVTVPWHSWYIWEQLSTAKILLRVTQIT